MLDQYIYGEVNRISPEAPVPILNQDYQLNKPGGAANVARNISAFGAQSVLVGIVGNDKKAELLLSSLDKENKIETQFLRSEARPTTCKTRILSGNNHMLRIDKESTKDLNEVEATGLLESLESLDWSSFDLVILQDYNKGLLTADIIRWIINKSLLLALPVAVDPKKRNFSMYAGCTLLKPNLREVRDFLDRSTLPTLRSLGEASDLLKKRIDHKVTLITLSEDGIYAKNDQLAIIDRPKKRKVIDVCGAGDGVLALASLGLSIPLALDDLCKWCNIAGGQICESVGVSIVNIESMLQEID